MWNKLSMAERAKYIQLAVQSGITNLNTIRRSYNSFARGGDTKWKEGIKEHKGIDVDNDSTYDYEGFYNSDPDRAWGMLDKDTNTHFLDEYKTVYHPTFSNQSIYSGVTSAKTKVVPIPLLSGWSSVYLNIKLLISITLNLNQETASTLLIFLKSLVNLLPR